MLDFNNILLDFQQLSGCEAEKMNEEISLVENAARRLEALIDEDKLTPPDRRACEYAAACCAVYDHVCKEVGRERIITTADGKACSGESRPQRIAAAFRLKIAALSGISGVVKDNGFLFKTAGGSENG